MTVLYIRWNHSASHTLQTPHVIRQHFCIDVLKFETATNKNRLLLDKLNAMVLKYI